MSDSDTGASFSRRASLYASSATHAAGDDLEVVARLADPQPNDRCLDVATGAGHTALRMAASGAEVIGVDIAEGMIQQARRLAKQRGIETVRYQLADAEHLPFPDGSFDLVTCRIAPHHFRDVGRAIAEVRRVLRPAGRFVLEDSLAPEDGGSAAFLHRIEMLRDPTHIRSLGRQEWVDLLQSAGMEITDLVIHAKSRPLQEWLERGGGDAEGVTSEFERAPESVRSTFLEKDSSGNSVFRDEKIICRAVVAGP